MKVSALFFSLSMLFSLSSQANNPDICLATRHCNEFGFQCRYELENCPVPVVEAETIKTFAVLNQRLSTHGYTYKGQVTAPVTFPDEIHVFVKTGSTTDLSIQKFCLLKSDLRTDCEGPRYELSCTDNPYIRVIIPMDEYEKEVYIRAQNLKKVFTSKFKSHVLYGLDQK